MTKLFEEQEKKNAEREKEWQEALTAATNVNVGGPDGTPNGGDITAKNYKFFDPSDPGSWSNYDPSTFNYDVGASGSGPWGEPFRRQMIEDQSGLGGFLEGISQAFGGQGTPGGYAGQNYLESLYNPARTAYDTLTTLGTQLKGTQGVGDFGQFAQNLFASGASPRGALGGLLGSGLEELAGYNPQTLSSLPVANQNRIRELINPDMFSDAEGTGWDAINTVVNLANQAQRQQYSPLALTSLRRGQGDAEQLFADYTRQQNPPGVGSGTTPGYQNFANFVRSRFGL
jgi:hypothetical protein